LAYLRMSQLTVSALGRGVAWLDTGTHDSLLASSLFVQTLEQRQGLKIACLEEIAFLKGFIGAAQLESLAEAYGKSEYALYLRRTIAEQQAGTGNP
jgi:glucose-1-phosphate thymidylyltransferase